MKAKILLMALLVSLLLIGGCSMNSKADYVNNAHQLTVATNGCTFAVPVLKLRGDMATIAAMSMTIHAGHNCSTAWYWYLQDPNINPQPDIFACATSAWIDLIALQKEAGIDANTPEYKTAAGLPPAKVTDATVTDADVEQAKTGLDTAVTRFDAAVVRFLKPEERECSGIN